jgi:hypothetical protein
VRKGDLGIVSGTPSIEAAAKQDLIHKEAEMSMEDKLVADTEEKKNELETFIYDLRGKLDDQYAELASEAEKERLREKLEASEVRSRSGTAEYLFLIYTDAVSRTGSTRRARTLPRASTLPRSRRSKVLPGPLSKSTAKRWRLNGRPCRRASRPRRPRARRRRTRTSPRTLRCRTLTPSPRVRMRHKEGRGGLGEEERPSGVIDNTM